MQTVVVIVIVVAAGAHFYPSNNVNYMTVQQPPPCDGANGSSFLSIGPQTEGTSGSFVSLQYDIKLLCVLIFALMLIQKKIYLVDASDTVILGMSNCCLRFLLYSNNRVSLASEIFGVFRAIIYNTSCKEWELRKREKVEKNKDDKKGKAEKLFDDVGKQLKLLFHISDVRFGATMSSTRATFQASWNKDW